MIVVCVKPTEPYGEISVRGLSESKLSVKLERSGVQSMWLHVANQKAEISVWRLINWMIPPSPLINQEGPTHFSIAKTFFLCGWWLIPLIPTSF